MRIVKPSRNYLWIFPFVLLALAGFVWSRPKSVSADKHGFDLDDLHGRYVSAEVFYDTSSVHAFADGNSSLLGGPIWLSEASVLQANGKGSVCGEIDAFGAYPPVGFNEGPAFYHGQYTVDANGRVAITTCSDVCHSTATGNPVVACTAICTDSSTCAAAAEGNSTRLQVGYLQDEDADSMVTVSQFEAGFPDSTGFVVHEHTWTRSDKDRDENHRDDRDHDRDHGTDNDHR